MQYTYPKLNHIRVATFFVAVCLTMHSGSAATIAGGLATSGGNYQWPSSTFLGGNEQTSANVTGSTGHDLDSNRDQGNTFTITQTGTIETIAFNFETFSTTGTSTITFNFFQVVSASDPTMVGGVIDSVIINASDVTGLGFVNDDEGTIIIDVVDTAVTAGATYAIQFDTDAINSHILKWRRDNTGNTYTDGQSFGNTTAASDYHFGAYGSIPEPSAALLSGLGICLLLRRRR